MPSSLLLILAAAANGPADAANIEPAEVEAAALEACVASAQTSVDHSQCFGSALKNADKRLNASWKSALELIGGRESEPGKALVAEQRLWIKFKEQACSFYWSQPYFGSMHRSIIGPDCKLSVLNARIEQLDDLITNLQPI